MKPAGALLLVAIAWCAAGAASPSRRDAAGSLPVRVSAVGRVSTADLRARIAALIDGRDPAVDFLEPAQRAELRAFYQPDESPLWLDAAGRPTANAWTALTVLTGAADDGLDPTDYGARPLGDRASRIDVAPPSDQVRFDVALSAGMLRYLHDVHVGRVDPRALVLGFDATRDHPHDFAALLRSAIAEERVAAITADLQPRFPQYPALREALAHYRSRASDPAFVSLPPFTATIHPGDPYAAIGMLRRDLVALGDLPAGSRPAADRGRYEGVLVDAVKRFQHRHGLPSDGVLGRSTIAALRVPTAWRVRQIELAMERMRWLPHAIDQRLIALNIPMFRLWAWDASLPDEAPALGMDVIVGRALKTETPGLVEEMREVIFRPYWNVPTSILRNEILPKLDRDPSYLVREGMEIVGGMGDDALAVDSSAGLSGLRSGALRVRQRPGPKNALGPIKFVFPNEADVYMHGTPAQGLFAKPRRDFSHGCVRVADPIALATWVLQDARDWTRDSIVAATQGSRTIPVKLPGPIMVILFYATAAVAPEDGTIHFADDIYQQDVTLDRALMTRRTAE